MTSTAAGPDWTSVATAIAGIGAVVFAALAVWFAASSTRAAWMTAQRSIEAADKATEALGRAIRPELFVNLIDRGPEHDGDPHLEMFILNQSPFPGEQIVVTVTLGPGFDAVEPVRAPYIGPSPDGRLAFDLGPQLGPRVIDLVKAGIGLQEEPGHMIMIEYSDRNRSLRWRQQWTIRSVVGGSDTEPIWRTTIVDRTHPEIVSAAPPPLIKPRWRDILLGRATSTPTD